MIDVKNISFSYGKKEILHNISTQFKQGELTFLIGPNGSGKSTFLSVIARMLLPDSGEITIEEKNYKTYSQIEFAKKISILFQERKFPDLTVYEFVSYGRYPHTTLFCGLSPKDELMVKEALQKTNTIQFAKKPLSILSGGERQRVYIAMLLCQDTPYILLDEPNTFLDLSHSTEILELLQSLKKDGKGIICVLHDIGSALKYGDRILLMDSGELILDCEPERAYNSAELKKAMNITCEKIILNGKTEYIPFIEKL